MARANFVQKAAKDNEKAGIKKGDSYYWWQLYKSPKQYSKTRPRPSQLTGSTFLSGYYALQERLEDLSIDTLEDLESELNEIAGEIRELGEEQESNKENMPEGLQEGDTGQLLQERADGMGEWADSIESMEFSLDFDGPKVKCSAEGCEWTSEDVDGTCPECGAHSLETDEYTEAVADKIQELIDEAQGNDPGLS